jgi:hypothetical protein
VRRAYRPKTPEGAANSSYVHFLFGLIFKYEATTEQGHRSQGLAALDEVMTKIPLEQATPGIKAAMAECILKAAANGQTSYDGLIAAASEQIQTILSMLT